MDYAKFKPNTEEEWFADRLAKKRSTVTIKRIGSSVSCEWELQMRREIGMSDRIGSCLDVFHSVIDAKTRAHGRWTRGTATLTSRVATLIFAVLLSNFIDSFAWAGHAPEIAYRVRNDGVNQDRFSDPELAARTSIDRYNLRNGTPSNHYIFDHIEPYTSNGGSYWRIFYLHYTASGGATGPWQYGSAAEKFYICDSTPMIGPQYGSDVQGLPKNHSSYPNSYPNGCSVPQVNADKNACASNCAGNPINVGLMTKVQEESDYRGIGAFPLNFIRRYSSNGFTDSALPVLDRKSVV